jgi:hypothetical protein
VSVNEAGKDLKTVEEQSSGGSNPSLSAIKTYALRSIRRPAGCSTLIAGRGYLGASFARHTLAGLTDRYMSGYGGAMSR